MTFRIQIGYGREYSKITPKSNRMIQVVMKYLMVKCCLPHICLPLTDVINLDIGYCPNAWKLSINIPIPKINELVDYSNIVEKFNKLQILFYFSKANFLFIYYCNCHITYVLLLVFGTSVKAYMRAFENLIEPDDNQSNALPRRPPSYPDFCRKERKKSNNVKNKTLGK